MLESPTCFRWSEGGLMDTKRRDRQFLEGEVRRYLKAVEAVHPFLFASSRPCRASLDGDGRTWGRLEFLIHEVGLSRSQALRLLRERGG